VGAPKRTNPVRVRDILVSALPELKDRLLEETIRTDWNRLIGPEMGRRSRPGRLSAGVLEVTVDNSPCLQEMTLRSRELLAALQGRFGAVASLKFTLGALPPVSGPVGPRSRPDSQPNPGREELRAIEAMVTTLPDPVLAGGLRRLLTKDLLARRVRDARPRPEDSRSAEREDS